MLAITGDWWAKLSSTWKGVLILAAVLSTGVGIGATGVTQLEVPRRLSAIEDSVAAISVRDGSMERRTNTRIDSVLHRLEEHEVDQGIQQCLLMRMMCRLDGGTPNACDLRYGGGRSCRP